MTGKDFVDNILYDSDRLQNLTADLTYRTMALGWLNLVLKDISSRQENYHWRFLEKTSYFDTEINQMSYDLPTDIDGYKIFSVRRADGDMRIDYVDQHIFDKYIPDPTTSGGNPDWYTLWAAQMKLWPIPGSVISIYRRYIKTITLLADNASSITDIPSKWDDVILAGALIKARRFDSKDYSIEKVDYENGILRMKSDNSMILDYNNIAESHRLGGRRIPWASPAGQ